MASEACRFGRRCGSSFGRRRGTRSSSDPPRRLAAGGDATAAQARPSAHSPPHPGRRRRSRHRRRGACTMCRSERWAARWYELQEGSGAVSRLRGAARVAIV